MAKCLTCCLALYLICICQFLAVDCGICTPDTKAGHVGNAAEYAALSRIASLQGVVWDWESYVIGVCPTELLKHKTAGAVKKSSKGDVVLGRTNQTHAASGGNWVLLVYRGGDSSSTAPCLGNYSSEIFIVCDRDQSHQGTSRFVEQDECVARFEISTSALCPPEGSSVVALVLAWSVIVLILYCAVGIAYRRVKLKVRGRQQLPHLPFWSRIGRGCADCCNWACRCEDEQAETWDAATDRDDVLLRP